MPKILNLRTHKNIDSNTQIRIDRKTHHGNPFKIGKDGNREKVIDAYITYFESFSPEHQEKRLTELRGKDLLCWCYPQNCHGFYLFSRANIDWIRQVTLLQTIINLQYRGHVTSYTEEEKKLTPGYPGIVSQSAHTCLGCLNPPLRGCEDNCTINFIINSFKNTLNIDWEFFEKLQAYQ